MFQFANLVIFAALVGTALVLRRRPATHQRLITLAVIYTLMIAPLAHVIGHFNLPVPIFPVWGIAVLVAFIFHDKLTLGRIDPATLWGGTMFVRTNVEAAVIGPSETWHRNLTWLAR